MVFHQRVITAAFAVMMLGIIATGIWALRFQKVDLRQTAEQELQAVAELKLKQLVDWRQNQLLECSELGGSRFFADGVARWLAEPRQEDAADILSRLRTLRAHYNYTDVVLVDPTGRARLSLSGRLDPLHAPTAEALATALRDRKPLLSDLHTDDEGIPHMAAIAPIFPEDGATSAPLAAVILHCDAAHFLFPLIQSWPTPSPSAETFLVRRDGDSALFLNDLRHQTNTALNLRIPLPQTDIPAVMAVLGKEGVVHGKDYRGVEVLATLRAVPDSPWSMVAKVDTDELFAVWRVRSVLIMLLLIALVASLGAGLLMVWQRNAKAHYRALLLAETSRRLSEARYGITLRGIGDAVIATDIEGRVELMNPVAEILTGWQSEEARGKPLTEVFRIVNEDTRQPVESPVGAVMRDGEVVDLANHTLLIARDGTERPIADSGAPIHDETGAMTGVVLIFRDQTKERAAQDEVQRISREWQMTFDTMNETVWILDKDQRILRSNKAAESMLLRPCREMVGKHCFEIVHGTTEPIPECPIQRMRRSLRREVMDLQLGDRWFAVSVDPILSADGQLTGAIHIVSDITARKLAEMALREREEKYRTLCCNIPGIIYRAKIDWSVEIISNSETVCGYSFEEFSSGKVNWLGLIHPDDRPRVLEEEEASGLTKRPTLLVQEYRIVAKDGGPRWVADRKTEVLPFSWTVSDIG